LFDVACPIVLITSRARSISARGLSYVWLGIPWWFVFRPQHKPTLKQWSTTSICCSRHIVIHAVEQSNKLQCKATSVEPNHHDALVLSLGQAKQCRCK